MWFCLARSVWAGLNVFEDGPEAEQAFVRDMRTNVSLFLGVGSRSDRFKDVGSYFLGALL